MVAQNTFTIDELIDNFEFLDDWEQRFTYLIDIGRKLPEMDEADKNEETRVHGCQATVYMKERVENGSPTPDPPVIELIATSDAHIVNGLIAILLAMFSGRTPKQIIETDAEAVFQQLGLEEHLSPTRRNGLHAMLKRIRAIAVDHA